MSKMSQAVNEIHVMDQLAARDQWVNRVHPLVKLVLTVGYLVILMSFPKYDVAGVLWIGIWPVALFVLADLSLLDSIRRLKIVLPLVCLMGLFNPLFDRQILMIHGIAVQAGWLSMFTLILKGVFSVLTAYLLIATTSVEKICQALKMLHIPKVMVTQIQLMYRYLTVLLEEADRITQAYLLRAPWQRGIHFKVWGSLTGQLLLKSMDRAGLVYESMLLRGYEGAKTQEDVKMSHIRIDVEQVSFSYESGREVLKDISFHASEHESIGLIGANGVGKSTLLKMLVGLNQQNTGTIRIEDIPVEKSTLPQIRSRVGYVFQDSDSQLFMNTVYEDVAFAPRNYGLPEDEVERRADRALEQTGISHLRNRQIYKLSGGEKKLVSIATILSMTPDMILMDEPSIALDPKNRRNLIRILNSFDHLKIIASHDLDMILDTCDRTILMADGRIVADGRTEEILHNKELLEKYDLELPLCMQR